MEIVVDTGEGSVREFDIVATKAGRRVEVTMARNTVEVTEVTRSGQPVRTAKFMASRVIALVEHPASDAGPDDDVAAPAPRRKPNPDQGGLGL